MRLALRAADRVRAQQQVRRLGPVACEAGVLHVACSSTTACSAQSTAQQTSSAWQAAGWQPLLKPERCLVLSCAVKEMPHGPSPHGPSARTLNELVLAGKELANKVQAADHDSAVSQYPCCEYRSQARVQR